MRFISPIQGYKQTAVHEEQEVLASGLPRITKKGFIAEFRRFDATHAEREQARATFVFRGTQMEAGSNRILDPIDDQHRVSVFDTGEITDLELRERVEQALLASPSFGHDYVLADQPVRLTAPWPAYDKLVVQGRRTIDLVAEKIAAMVVETGADPAHVIAYERENANRPEVIAALEGEAAEQVDELVVA